VEGKPGVVVNDRKRVAALSVRERKVALEVHLPKPVGGLFFEALVGAVAHLVLWFEKSVPLHDRLAGRGSWNLVRAKWKLLVLGLLLEASANLAPAPGGMLVTHLTDSGLDSIRSFVRRLVRAPRPLGEPFAALFAISVQPLVSGFSADVKPAAEGAHVGLLLVGKHNEFEFKGHLGSIVPGHGPLRDSGEKSVSGNVLPMSRNTC
jgi:hypothetical protein